MKAASVLLGSVFSAFLAVAGSSDALAQITIAHNGVSTLIVNNLQFSIGTCTFRESTGANHICGAADLLYLKAGTGAGAGIDIVRQNGAGVEVPIFSATGGATGTWDLAVQIKVKVLGVSETVTAGAAGIYGSVTGGVAGDLTKVTGGETFALASGTAPSLNVNLAAPSPVTMFSTPAGNATRRNGQAGGAGADRAPAAEQ